MGKVKASRQAIEMLSHDLMGVSLDEINGSWIDKEIDQLKFKIDFICFFKIRI